MDRTSLANNTIELRYTTAGENIPIDVQTNTSNAKVQTINNVISSSSFVLKIGFGAKDVAGNKMTADYLKSFTPAYSMPPPPPPPPPAPIPPPIPFSPPDDGLTPLPPIIKTIDLVSGSKTVTGTVLYSDGSPATDQYVGAYETVTGEHTQTPVDAQGSYTLSLFGGAWRIGVFPVADNGQRSRVEPVRVIFNPDSSPETRNVPFTLPLVAGKIYVTAMDDSGSPIANASVTVDSLSGSGDSDSGPRVVITKSTNPQGAASFTVRTGTYYVRGNPPSTSLISPNETSVTVGGTAALTVHLVFHSASSEQDADTLTGTTHFDDGTPAPNAFIYAWSEEGASLDARSEENGTFSLPLPRSSHWRIGARKMRGGGAYMSSEIEVTSGLYGQPLDIVLVKRLRAIQNLVVVLPKSGGGGQSVNAPMSAANSTTGYSISSDVISPQSPNLKLSVIPTIEVPTQAATEIIGVAYDVTLRDTNGVKVTNFSQKIEIDLPYSLEDLHAEGATESTIRPSYFDEKSNTWVPIDDFYVDTAHHVVVVHVAHLTRFAIVSPADITAPPPPSNVAAAVAGANVQLSWRNPAGDFDHAKVYRSTALGKLGSVLATEVRATLFADTSTTKGSKYFYTVRSIDLAGNESENTNQVSVDGVGAGTKGGKGTLTKTLSLGMSGKEVTLLQTILKNLGFLTTAPSGYFGSKTKIAVIAFQQAYAKETLTPAGLTKGSGVVGALSRKKLNALSGGN